jgi:hypothetical protein
MERELLTGRLLFQDFAVASPIPVVPPVMTATWNSVPWPESG